MATIEWQDPPDQAETATPPPDPQKIENEIHRFCNELYESPGRWAIWPYAWAHAYMQNPPYYGYFQRQSVGKQGDGGRMHIRFVVRGSREDTEWEEY